MIGFIQLAATIAIVFRMLHVGLCRPIGRVLSWPMYSYSTLIIPHIEVYDGHVRSPLNLYKYLPRGEYAISSEQIISFAKYFDTNPQLGEAIDIKGVAYGEFGRKNIRLEADGVDAGCIIDDI